ncbi:heme lyase CcmF/NrfE family subunit [Terasakiella sp. SH-1]|uniref:heme lyase CcmF/NrfE family subunit n=1 Tax=Terasakiella sp. SH-1 TaxID=2560057 RepID=UPI0010730A43|nr:heme lyase CcmF/NrfE family subunit [Terasakiella sp. SH-1]
MYAEIGHFALIMALFVAVVQGVVPLAASGPSQKRWMGIAGPASIAQFILIAVAFAALTHAFVTSDFSVLNVAKNSHTDKPMLYKVSGVWGNHEGSMLLWVLILATFGCAVEVFGRNLPAGLKNRTLAVQSLITVGFLLFILFTSNPFERLINVPLNGQSLNPLLQDPGLAFHPPFLYLGYVGFSIAYSFAIAALIEGRVDASWARWVRPWTLAAWVFLTIGIALGSWWAYYELGWGGWWFWDPVENASFMPWLAGTALLHSAIVVEKRDALKSWTIFLAIIAFGLSLLGTFLVRSGVLTSVHAFATDPERGVFILILLCIAIGGSFFLYALRGPSLVGGGLFKPVSREGSLLFNNWILTTATGVVLLGTLYPLFIDVIGAGKVSVGAPFYNRVFIPIMTPLVILMALGPLMSWKRADATGILSRLYIVYGATLVAVVLTFILKGEEGWGGYLGMGLATWLATGVLWDVADRIKLGKIPFADSMKRLKRQPRSTWGMTIAHFGLAVTIAGMTGAGNWKVEKIQVMNFGDKLDVAGYTYTFEGVSDVRGPNYDALEGTFSVHQGDEFITTLRAEKREYDTGGMPTTEAAIYTMFLGDLYAVVGDKSGDGYVTRLYWNPLVAWLWGGSALLTLGGLVSLSDRRHRVGAPKRSKAKPSAQAVGAQA